MNCSAFRYSSTLLKRCNTKTLTLTRLLSSKEARERRHHLFQLEKKRQLENVGRIDKIEVRYKGVPEDCTLVMNRGISTPFDCAKHLSDWHAERSALALIDDTVYWDMHKPLTENCTLEFQHYNAKEPHAVNLAFWRTCSLVLGACATHAFKDDVEVHLHSFPRPNIRSGSFVYDVELPSLQDWKPTPQELITLSAEYVKLVRKAHPIERLEVSEELALEMFKENRHKTAQIPSIARATGRVTLYKVGEHVDISKGPMVNNAAQIGRVAVAAVHRLPRPPGSAESSVPQLYRFQGVALPLGVILNHFAFSILTDRAKKLNSAINPMNPTEQTNEEVRSPPAESIAASA